MAALKRLVLDLLPAAVKEAKQRDAARLRTAKWRGKDVTHVTCVTSHTSRNVTPSLPPSPSFPPDPHNNPLPPTHPASPLAVNFADPDHASAYERLRVASGRGLAVDAGLRAIATGMRGGPAYDWPTIGQALVEMDAAGAKFSAEAVRGFCRRLLRPAPDAGWKASKHDAANAAIAEGLARLNANTGASRGI